MIESNALASAAGVQYQGIKGGITVTSTPTIVNGVIIGRFKRGRMDRPFKVTSTNYKALLGDDPFNPSFTVVDDAFIAGASEVMIMRIGGVVF